MKIIRKFENDSKKYPNELDLKHRNSFKKVRKIAKKLKEKIFLSN